MMISGHQTPSVFDQYMLSGYFPKMNPMEYAVRVAKYYPPYVTFAFFYVAFAAAMDILVASIVALKPGPSVSGAPKGL